MVSEKVIRRRLERLEEALRRLEEKKESGLKEFLENWELQDIIVREFEVAIDACLDIGTHIISEKGWGIPEKYPDIARILTQKGVLPQEFEKKLIKWITFRNTKVCEYLYIDLKKVYRNLEYLDDFREFARYTKDFLEKEGK